MMHEGIVMRGAAKGCRTLEGFATFRPGADCACAKHIAVGRQSRAHDSCTHGSKFESQSCPPGGKAVASECSSTIYMVKGSGLGFGTDGLEKERQYTQHSAQSRVSYAQKVTYD